MRRYLLHRLGQSALMLIGLLIIVFVLLRLSGDPTNLLAPRDATPDQRQAIRSAYGFDRPVLVQFWHFAVDAVRLDFGSSIRYKQPVRSIIFDRMPATLELGVVAVVFSMAIGIPLGVLAGMKPRRGIDGGARGLALLGQTIPDFWLALVLILVFAVKLDWFPPFGRETFAARPVRPAEPIDHPAGVRPVPVPDGAAAAVHQIVGARDRRRGLRADRPQQGHSVAPDLPASHPEATP